MGSGASNPYAELPEKLNRTQLETVCGDRFDAEVFDFLKDSEDDMVPRAKFLEWIADEQETTVFDRYVSYQQEDGKMSKRELVSLLRDSKLLKKRKFVVADLDILDAECQRDAIYEEFIPYPVFRNIMIPRIAEKSGDTVSHILYRITQCEERVVFHMGSLCNKSDNTARLMPVDDASDEQKRAAGVIGRYARGKIAREEMQSMKDIKKASEGYNPEKDFQAVTDDKDLEDKMERKYLEYASKVEGVIGMEGTLTMLRECDIISSKFTVALAKRNFKVVMAKTKAANAPHDIKICLVSNKYLRYTAFRSMYLPIVAELKGLSTEDLIHYFVD